jgi:hypothetical protein
MAGQRDRPFNRSIDDTQFCVDRLISAIDGNKAQPIPMLLFCPRCGAQHIDAELWENPPHRSHQCHVSGCNTIWRPADVTTEGVRNLKTMSPKDTWRVGQPVAPIKTKE